MKNDIQSQLYKLALSMSTAEYIAFVEQPLMYANAEKLKRSGLGREQDKSILEKAKILDDLIRKSSEE